MDEDSVLRVGILSVRAIDENQPRLDFRDVVRSGQNNVIPLPWPIEFPGGLEQLEKLLDDWDFVDS